MALKIRSFSASGGVLKDALKGQTIKFADGLNAIVGDAGSGKTSIVETIGFAFGLEPSRVWLKEGRGQPHLFSLPKAVLGPGTVHCEVEDEGTAFAFERHVDAHTPRIVRREKVEAWTPDFRDRVELYSAVEMRTIGFDPIARLAWLDRSHRSEIDRLSEEFRAVRAKYRRLGPQYRKAAEERNNEREQEQLAKLQEELRAIEKTRAKKLPGDVAAAQKRFLGRWESFYQLEAMVKERPKSLAALLRFTGLGEVLGKAGAKKKISKADMVRAIDPLQAVVDEMGDKGALDRAQELAPEIGELRRTLEDEDRDYRALQEKRCPELMESILKEDRLAVEVNRLEREVSRRKEAFDEIAREREQIRSMSEQISAEIFAKRSARAAELNEELEGRYEIELSRGALREDYEKTLRELLAPACKSAAKTWAACLARKATPDELARAILEHDKKHAVEKFGLEESFADRLLWDLYKEETFVTLEETALDDWVDIIVFHDDGPPRPLRAHSPGETSIHGFRLMLTDRDCPLVFDYSEASLTPGLVRKELGDLLIEVRKKRQVIFVTHTPELLDHVEPEQVIVLDHKNRSAPVAGPLSDVRDDVRRILGPTVREATEHLRQESDQEKWGKPWSPEGDSDVDAPGD